MSVHIAAEPNDIAPYVLLPGDPLRAKFIATEYLEDVRCYNEVRGMLGFTGHYKGIPVSVQGSGMGMPSMSIYVNELLQFYGVKRIIRVGSCGSLQEHIKVRDIIIAMSASTDSQMNLERFPAGSHYAATASFSLLHQAYQIASQKEVRLFVGSIFSTDSFYHEEEKFWKKWAQYGALGVEMESNQLYALCAKYQAEALAILTVSDSLISHEELSSEEREKGFRAMAEIALDTIIRSN